MSTEQKSNTETFKAARAWLADPEHHWTRGIGDGKTCACIGAAILIAEGKTETTKDGTVWIDWRWSDPGIVAISDFIRKKVPGPNGGQLYDIVDYNDSVCLSKEEALALLDRAIEAGI